MIKNSSVNAGDAGPVTGLRNPQEKETATHTSILAWRIPWTEEPSGLQTKGSQKSWTLAWKIPWMEEPGRLQSMGSLRVGHD